MKKALAHRAPAASAGTTLGTTAGHGSFYSDHGATCTTTLPPLASCSKSGCTTTIAATAARAAAPSPARATPRVARVTSPAPSNECNSDI